MVHSFIYNQQMCINTDHLDSLIPFRDQNKMQITSAVLFTYIKSADSVPQQMREEGLFCVM
jgi:hypothetical protein